MKRRLPALFLLALLLAARVPAPGYADTEENIQTIYTYLTETAGLNRAAACGILSNIKSESNFNPEAIGDSGAAYGICQWNSRRNSLISYCETNGFESWKSLEGQLGYLQYELENNKKSVGSVLRSLPDTAQGAFDAAWYFCVYFEIPADRYNKGNTRGANAVNIYWKKFGGTTESYPMTYDANGGTGAPASGTKTEGVPFKITAAAPTRKGYEFLGWSEDKSAAEPALSAGGLFSENRAATFYAVWGQALPDDAEPAKTVTRNGRRYELFTGARVCLRQGIRRDARRAFGDDSHSRRGGSDSAASEGRERPLLAGRRIRLRQLDVGIRRIVLRRVRRVPLAERHAHRKELRQLQRPAGRGGGWNMARPCAVQ